MRHAGGLCAQDKILHLTQQDPLPSPESGPAQASLETDAGHVGSPNSRGTFLRGHSDASSRAGATRCETPLRCRGFFP